MKHLLKRFIHTSAGFKAMIVLVLVGLLAFFLPIRITPLDVGNLLGATSIFYSILLGFYISASMTNLSRLKTLTATETGALIATHRIIKLSLPDKVAETEEAIDKYLIKRFDYEVNEYAKPTTDEYFAIFNVLKDANTKSEGQGAALNYAAEAMYYVAQARREMTIVGAKLLTPASWLILLTLSLVIVISLFLMRDGSFESFVFTTLLATSAIMALFILQDVDGNLLGEEDFSIATYQGVFDAIGKLHYYPTAYIKTGRYHPTVAEYRTGSSGDVRVVKNRRITVRIRERRHRRRQA